MRESSEWDAGLLDLLLRQLTALRADLLQAEARGGSLLKPVHPAQLISARTLVHYLALRRHDLRSLQEGLASVGLSSVGAALGTGAALHAEAELEDSSYARELGASGDLTQAQFAARSKSNPLALTTVERRLREVMPAPGPPSWPGRYRRRRPPSGECTRLD